MTIYVVMLPQLMPHGVDHRDTTTKATFLAGTFVPCYHKTEVSQMEQDVYARLSAVAWLPLSAITTSGYGENGYATYAARRYHIISCLLLSMSTIS